MGSGEELGRVRRKKRDGGISGKSATPFDVRNDAHWTSSREGVASRDEQLTMYDLYEV
jgi:hypothetical protein